MIARHFRAFNQALAWIADKGWPGGREAWLLHRELLASPDAALMDARVRERLLAASHQDPAVLETFLAQRKSWQQALAAELDGAVLITPTVAHTAPELAPLMQDDDLFAQTNLATPAVNHAGQSAGYAGNRFADRQRRKRAVYQPAFFPSCWRGSPASSRCQHGRRHVYGRPFRLRLTP
ncbi:hypothetical protein WDV93_13720 [Pantoea ananatis]